VWPYGTTNSGMETAHNHQGVLSEERMIKGTWDRPAQTVLDDQRDKSSGGGGAVPGRLPGVWEVREGSGTTGRGGPGGFEGIVLVGGSDRGEGGEVLRDGSAEVSDHQGLVEQDGKAGRAQLGEGAVGARGDGGVRDSHGVQADRGGAGAEEAVRAVLPAQAADRDAQEQRPGDLRGERGCRVSCASPLPCGCRRVAAFTAG
jgi:hypothetical protein